MTTTKTTRPKAARSHPDLSFETTLGQGRRVCGIDEVGRGPLAGPVVAAAVVLPPEGLPQALARAINDSKALSRAAREDLEPEIRAHALAFALAEATAAEIDHFNIHKATLLAMKRAYEALTGEPPAVALIDGKFTPDLPCLAEAIVKGDGKSQSIAAASIIAKVARDREMCRLAELHPHYGWDRNAGYPTPEHLEALRRHGVTDHHRVSFAPVREQKALSN
ncbi:ribonuclease HII [Azospirillum soli]|uniref:ribonuclease HII n=1 Tax=Azospirillum soli TaxID=1304799 RepID=UPI001AE8E93B|nr:ribonuclease HII [Azospirillum soli]MBP2315948.1 ribonuclease HII [Azospirillum soli]